MATIPINIMVDLTSRAELKIDIDPDNAMVPRNSDGNVSQLNWFVPNGSRATITAFQWNSIPEGAFRPAVAGPFPTTFLQSAAYENNIPTAQAKWTYTITMTNGTDTATIDPEVDNDPPS